MPNMNTTMPRTIFILLLLLCSIFESSGFKPGQNCTMKVDGCGSVAATGLQCDTCDELPPRCTRIRPFDPKIKGWNLPFNRYSWLTTHNSFSMAEKKSHTGVRMVTAYNQQDTITQQLNNGVRGLMLDLYDFRNDIWLCHSFNGICQNFTAFQPAINVFKEIARFLRSNSYEVVTVFIEDYVKIPRGLTKLFESSEVTEFLYPLYLIPKKTAPWPKLSTMIKKNHRLIVFTSNPEKEKSEEIAYQWKYVVETEYGDKGMPVGSCSNRKESLAMNMTKQRLVVFNYFANVPNFFLVCHQNSLPLIQKMETCVSITYRKWPNFIAVDFYKKSDGNGAPHAVDVANGHLMCGCNDVARCKFRGMRHDCLPPPESDYDGTPKPSSSTVSDQNRMKWLSLIRIGLYTSTLLLLLL